MYVSPTVIFRPSNRYFKSVSYRLGKNISQISNHTFYHSGVFSLRHRVNNVCSKTELFALTVLGKFKTAISTKTQLRTPRLLQFPLRLRLTKHAQHYTDKTPSDTLVILFVWSFSIDEKRL